MRLALRNIILCTLPSVFIVCIVLEIFLRLSGYTPFYLDGRAFAVSPDSRIVYELRPGFRGLYAGVLISINSYGFRGGEPANDGAESVV